MTSHQPLRLGSFIGGRFIAARPASASRIIPDYNPSDPEDVIAEAAVAAVRRHRG